MDGIESEYSGIPFAGKWRQVSKTIFLRLLSLTHQRLLILWAAEHHETAFPVPCCWHSRVSHSAFSFRLYHPALTVRFFVHPVRFSSVSVFECGKPDRASEAKGPHQGTSGECSARRLPSPLGTRQIRPKRAVVTFRHLTG